jgi:hypothetical protein
MSLFDQNNKIFSSHKINNGPSIISRKSAEGINEINMKYDGASAEEVEKLLANYSISKYSLNDGIYIFKINSDNELIDKFVGDAYSGPLGRQGNYSILRGMPGYKDSNRFKAEFDGINLESHISCGESLTKISKKSIEQIIKTEPIKKVEQEIKKVVEIKNKYFSEEEVLKMQKTNNGLKYAFGVLALVAATNIGLNFYLHNRTNTDISDLAAKLNTTKRQVQLYKKQENNHYDELSSNLFLKTTKLSKNLVEVNDDLVNRINDTNKDVENLDHNFSKSIDSLNSQSKKGDLALLDIIESNNEHYDAITTNMIKTSENLNTNLKEKTNKLSVQIEDVKNQKLTSPWYLIKTGFSNAYSSLVKWNNSQVEKVKEFEETNKKKD